MNTESLRILYAAGLWLLGLIGKQETSDGRFQRGRLMVIQHYLDATRANLH